MKEKWQTSKFYNLPKEKQEEIILKVEKEKEKVRKEKEKIEKRKQIYHEAIKNRNVKFLTVEINFSTVTLAIATNIDSSLEIGYTVLVNHWQETHSPKKGKQIAAERLYNKGADNPDFFFKVEKKELSLSLGVLEVLSRHLKENKSVPYKSRKLIRHKLGLIQIIG
jgi:hypothetical protein